MSEAIQLEECRDETSSPNNYPLRKDSRNSSGGGYMDDVLKRLGMMEVQVGSIAAVIPHLATKADLNEIKGQVNGIAATIPHLATKADLNDLRSEIGCMETRIIKWIITTVIATAALAFTIAKFVH